MATPTLTTTNFTRINDCDSATGWSNLGGGGSPGVNADVVIQGNGAIGRRVDNGTGGYALDLGGSTLDFSPGGANEGEHIFFWVNILQPTLINSAVLRLSEDASAPNPGNSLDYEFFPATPYTGGWQRIVIDPRSIPTTINGSATYDGTGLNAVRWIGFFFDMGNVGGTSSNCNIDAIDRGRGLIVTGGTALDKITWDDIEAVSTSNTNAYGLIEKRSGIFTLRGEWQFGDASNNCYFEDTNKTIVFANSYTKDLATTPNTKSSQAPNLNKIVVVEGTGTTDFINGVKVGTGNDASGISGCSYQVTPTLSGVKTFASIDFSDADITNVELFGCNFRGIVGGHEDDISIKFCADATNGPNHEVSGCTFDQCGLVDPGRVSMQNNIFSSTAQSSKFVPFDQVTAEDSSASSFTNLTNASLRDTTGDIAWSNVDSNTNDAVYFGLKDKFEGLDCLSENFVDATPAAVWEYWDGTAWTLFTVTAIYLSSSNGAGDDLGPSSNNYGGLRYTFTAPSDWGLTSVNGSSRLYFIRYRKTANDLTTGNAVVHWAFAHTPFNGAALLWNSNIDIVNSTFIANTDADTNEKAHGVEHRSSGTFSYTNLQFSGNDADILFKPDINIVDSYEYSNFSSNTSLTTTRIAIGQTFTGDGSDLGAVSFFMRRSGATNGTLVAKLYAHTGTFGTNGVPTGPALSTSASINASTVPNDPAVHDEMVFTFTDNYTLVNTTKYVIVVEYSGTSSTLLVATDNTSPSHGGNYVEDSSGWSAISTIDTLFIVQSSAGLVITASAGANPTTYTVVGIGTVTINTLINVTLTGLVASPATEVRVYETGTTNEIDGAENVVSGSFTFQADATDFVDIVVHNVEYEYLRIDNFDVPGSDVSIPIQQRFDRNYDNP